MLSRIVTALVLIPLVLGLVIYAPPRLFLAALGLVGTLCLYEYYAMVLKMGIRGQPWLGYAGLWFLLAGLHERWLPAPLVIAVLVLAILLAGMWRSDGMRERVLGIGANLLGVLYLGLLLWTVLPVRFDFGQDLGLRWLVILLVVIWTGDTAALVVGRRFGRTLFSPSISPRKTNEGAVGGLLGGLAAALLLQRFLFTDLPPLHVGVLALLMGMFGQLGDLAESLLKRAAGVKDSSSLIPGHGGVLDRLDSLLFAFPVLYFYMLALYSP